MSSIRELVQQAKADPRFQEVHGKFATAEVRSWLTEDEKALHFAIGAFATRGGTIVEIGSFEGGSACFLAAGVARRGAGKVTCIDPHLGGPPWLGMAPRQRTLETFRRGTRHCGVADWIDVRVGDSVAVASVWPAAPIDAVFIDGDHSFLGALKDFECWGPKVKPGGLVMIDDANDPSLPELLELIRFVQGLGSVRYLDTIDGIALFERTEMAPEAMLDELARALDARRIYRPWNFATLHRTGLPPHYLKSKTWDDKWLDEAYQLGFLARCGAGAYGYTPSMPSADRAMIRGLAKDRGDGPVIEIGGLGDSLRGLVGRDQTRFRVIFCRPDEAARYAPRLLPGGLLLARQREAGDMAYQQEVRRTLLAAGLEGCGFGGEVHWGVWQPHHLASDAVVDFALAAVA
jgi:predicted O-methyltransferase YrrM